MIPGWPYSVVAALDTGRTSWTSILDAQRLRPSQDETAITAAQLRDVVTRLIEAGQWSTPDPDILIVFDAGYDIARLDVGKYAKQTRRASAHRLNDKLRDPADRCASL